MPRVLFLLGLVLLPVLAGADAAEPAVQLTISDGVYAVEGTFDVPAPSSTAWDVLSDYDHIGRFVSSIQRSVIRKRRDDGVLLEQEALGHIFFVSRAMRVLLDVREEAPRTISFRDIAQTDFEQYAGSWKLTTTPSGSRVVYQLRAKPRAGLPGFLGKPAFKNSIAGLLTDVRREIVRRTQHSAN